MLERALAIQERAYGRDSTQVALMLGNLGLAHGALGDNSKKCELLERALPIFEGAYGADHPHTEMYQEVLSAPPPDRRPDSRNSITCVVS